MNSTPADIPLAYFKGVGATRAQVLASELGLTSAWEALQCYPFRYIDRSRFYKIGELQDSGSDVQIIGRITQMKLVPMKRGKRLVAYLQDDTGTLELVWFRGYKYIQEQLKSGEVYVAFGRLNRYQSQWNMAHPELELKSKFEQQQRSSLQPVYPSTEILGKKGITQRLFRAIQQQAFQQCRAGLKEVLPPDLIARLQLIGREEAFRHIHFPENADLLAKARFRLKFEEFFFMQLHLLTKNIQHKQRIKGLPFEKVGNYFGDFYQNHLPFELTGAQKRVVKEIRNDLGKPIQMNRLLQGDVGSGKTMVALLSMLLAVDNGFQACLMAPTEILAQQHYKGLTELLEPLGLEIGLLTGSVSKKDRQPLLEGLASGELKLIVGTHALLEKQVEFQQLGLAIIDEQHRFGVAQRSKLWKKNSIPPHILVMTATPIPRTLAMSVYGDLDNSVIDEMPPGRKPVKTEHWFDKNRLKMLQFLKQEIAKGRQAYIVYPLIQESSKMDYKDLMDGYESISRDFPQPQYQISIVHGQMKAEDKEFEMQRFVRGETQIMVATTVIEVGVNVPNASVMVIESAERFGLSQLHQLRGRVGRGADQSYCILMSSYKLSDEAKTRMSTMVNSQDGFQIAEVDLKLRGPGDLLGTQQSGVLQLKIADLVKDNPILKRARSEAFDILKDDPKLEKPEHQLMKRQYQLLYSDKALWGYIS